MKLLSNLFKNCNCITLVLFLLFVSCSTTNMVETNGGVYVSNVLIESPKKDLDSINPILALRIDDIRSDTLLIKYRIGFEAHMNIDYIYNQECNCYESEDKLKFSPRGSDRHDVTIYLLDKNRISLQYSLNDSIIKSTYSLTYIDSVDLNLHRDPYYAEESGFSLFKKIIK